MFYFKYNDSKLYESFTFLNKLQDFYFIFTVFNFF